MNEPPINPINEPPNPANHVVPPYGNPTIQIIDPPDELPEDSAEAIPIISEVFASRRLVQSYNVRANFIINLGTHHSIHPFTRRGVTDYTTMTRAK